jgi:glycine oxidase
MSRDAPPDILVVGGGVIGLSIAWLAAVAGRSVAVVDPAPGRGASWAAAGMLAPVGEAQFGEERLTALNLEAARAWPAFAVALEAASGLPVHLVSEGTLLVALDPSDRASLDDLLDYRGAHGLATDRLTSSRCRAAEPLLAPSVRGGALVPGDHQVDNRCVVEALSAACRSAGVVVVHDEVAEVTTSGHPGALRATGVTLRGGATMGAGTVVVAAGCRSGQVGGLPPAALPPVRPVKGLTLRLVAPAGQSVLRRTVRGLVHGRTCYLVPRADRSLVVGASVEEKGFDTTVQAGPVGDELVDITAGLRPGSPDNAPLVGTVGVDRLVVATGHYRNGFLLAPLTASAVVGLLSGGTRLSEGPFAGFGADRFASRPGPSDLAAVAGAVPGGSAR